jgi:hypothetical protein
MRTEVIDYIKGQKFLNYQATDELPFNNSGTEMYLKNPKRFYVDVEQTSREEFLPVLNGTIDSEVTTVRVFFSNDAKQLPKNYSAVVANLVNAKENIARPEHFRKTSQVTTEQIQDLTVTTIEYQFTKILT